MSSWPDSSPSGGPDFEGDSRPAGGRNRDGTFVRVVSTLKLCSIPEVDRALGEVHRVLMPGGRFDSLEHGLSGGPGVQEKQRRPNPI